MAIPEPTRGSTTVDKQRAADGLTNLLGMPRVDISTKQRGTVPAAVFREAARRANVEYRSRPAATEAVIRKAGHAWSARYDSRESASEGGGNVTVAGLIALTRALESLIGQPAAAEEGREYPASTSQGRMTDSKQRKKIENAAQDWLMTLYRGQGYDVIDTRSTHPYDAVARKEGVELFLEAKGTTSTGAKVLVTRNEVAWARAHAGQCIMGIWSEMVFDAHGEVDVTVGRRRVLTWNPLNRELSAVAYEWEVTERP